MAYTLVTKDGVTGIRCLTCGRTSYHPEDVRHKYCGHCHIFHDKDRAPKGYGFFCVWCRTPLPDPPQDPPLCDQCKPLVHKET
jgi:ribosomal protein L37E